MNSAIGLERLSLRVGVIPTIRLAVAEHHYPLAAEWLGMMYVISHNEREMANALQPMQEAVMTALGDAVYRQRFEHGMTLVLEQEVPRLQMYIEQRYPDSHPGGI